MKFKALFVIFNIVLILSFLTIFFLPFFLLDAAFMLEFWRKNWYFAAVFAIVLAVVNGLFASQWKLLSCLEREDWPALARHLESTVITKGRYTKRSVRLYCDALILLSDFEGVKKLSTALEGAKPALFAFFASRFAAAAILSGDFDRAYAIATGAPEVRDPDSSEWRRFYAAFSRHLARKPEESAAGLESLAREARNPLVAVLAGYLCANSPKLTIDSRGDAREAAASEARLRVCAVFTPDRWNRYVEESKADMQVVILGKLIAEATAWLFAGEN